MARGKGVQAVGSSLKVGNPVKTQCIGSHGGQSCLAQTRSTSDSLAASKAHQLHHSAKVG